MQKFRLDRSLIRVAGPDCVTFLNNLLTQNVERLDREPVVYSALLSPQGKVIADMLLWQDGDEDEAAIVIEADRTRADDLLKRLTLYKLRAQVTIEDVSTEFTPGFSADPFDGGIVDPRMPDGALGWRELSPLPRDWSKEDDGAAAYDALRIARGVPDLARDAQPEEVFAGEALLDELNAIDFQKGCFVGQENVSRMKRRATTRKKFCPVVFDGEAPAFGAAVVANGAELGQIRTGAPGRALALLRLDRAFDALDAGHRLEAEGRELRLDPPSWLILPQREASGTASPD